MRLNAIVASCRLDTDVSDASKATQQQANSGSDQDGLERSVPDELLHIVVRLVNSIATLHVVFSGIRAQMLHVHDGCLSSARALAVVLGSASKC